MYSKPSSPLSIGGVLDDGFRLGREAFPKTWPLALAAQILLALPIVAFSVQHGAAAVDDIPGLMAQQSSGYSLLYFGIVLLSLGLQNAITAQNARIAANTATTRGESMSIGFRLLPRAVLLGLLLLFGFTLIALCFMIPGLFLPHAGRVLLMGLSLVPVCFYLSRIFLANVIFVAEDSGAYASLLRSWYLTKDHFWHTAAILAVLFIAFTVLLLLIGLLGGLVVAVLGANNTMSLALVQLISAAGYTLFTPLISAVSLSIYYDLKFRKEGTDLGGVESIAQRPIR